MTLEISSTLLARLLNEAANAPEQEVCGLLFGTAERLDAVRPCRNVAAEPDRAFEIDPAALIAAHRATRDGGPAIIGCYHSHPNGAATPSARDAAAAAPDGALWIIIADPQVACYRAVCDGAYVGRFDPVPYRIETA
ncbi:proteasome lid subunit RPN8/RPN11 [Sphingomonas sp. BE270]|jgi:proteasome lid subunit RPN8/RPN11|uniref:M67 family metallopeptidase n=1 Tax=unclassified Sphingomonas TaxID=196159 RepID=UPI00053E0757|nr:MULTISPECIES: M67 family metallopeptidase [unclassified Sphingomonas]MDR6849157.1 proteasome lid subunit RPN8/RPN11 [Sphingomonas sp. BE137]MDR7259418.1 proteasome lid subunit RPN8/RPN11 [Sphingomonas sp. BE270]